MKRVNILTAHCVQGATAFTDEALPSVMIPVTYRKGDLPDETSSHDMALHDGRPFPDRFSLDTSGFQLCGLDAPLSASFTDMQSVSKHVYPVAQALVAQATGACKVLAFDHSLRDQGLLQKEADAGIKRHDPQAVPFVGAPVQMAHNDYTVRSGFTRARQLLEPYCKSTKVVDDILKGRFAIVNFWYPLETVTETPLALCEWGSVSPRDVRTVHLDYGYVDYGNGPFHRTGETYGVHHNPSHKWVYYSRMQPNEALLFKQFDSSEKVARFALHSAVQHKEPGEPAKPRRSLEVRCLVFYDGLPEDIASQFVAPHIKMGYAESQSLKRTILPLSNQW